MQRMGGRVVEGTGLENRQACKRLEGSNPSPSASTLATPMTWPFAAELDGVLGR
jgi:hypothetical protein